MLVMHHALMSCHADRLLWIWMVVGGEDGFIRLPYGTNACGLTNDPTWVTVVDAVPSPAPEVEKERLVEDILTPRPRETAALRETIEMLQK